MITSCISRCEDGRWNLQKHWDDGISRKDTDGEEQTMRRSQDEMSLMGRLFHILKFINIFPDT
jgi:hypothetical protein